MTTYDVRMLSVGHGEIPGPELFWMSRWDEWFPLTFQVGLIRGPGVTALVNTGPAADLEPMNRGWAEFLGERAAMRREGSEFVIEQLAAQGVRPGDITHVVLTPLQLYSISNLLAFEHAEICIARRGWVHFHTTHTHPHDDRATSIPDDILIPLVTTAWPRVRLLEDEDVVAPGIRTWWCGVHHRASVVVEVATSEGTVALTDALFYLDNLELDHPIGINESLEEARIAYRRIRETADIAVPLYDPRNFTRFPNGHVA